MNWTIFDDVEILDSRDILARVDELRGCCVGKEEAEEFRDLLKICEQGEGFPGWLHGAFFIRDDYFPEYAKELAEDIGMVSGEGSMDTYIDWNQVAEDWKSDYGDLEINGETYWGRY